MKREVYYEWCCEYVDVHGDIQDHDRSLKLADVWPPQLSIEGCTPVLALVRIAGNNQEGELERGYAYSGDDHFSCFHKVPVDKFKALNRVSKQ